MKIEAITLLSSALCNLSCKYCYISQDLKMKESHNKLIAKIKNEKFLTPAIKHADDVNDIKTLGLWGLEPSLTLDVISERFDYIFDTLPALRTISFSSNFQRSSDGIIDFIKKLPTDKKVNVDIQYSIDGMPKINDLTRGLGSGEKIVYNVKDLLNSLNTILPTQPNVSISIQDKGTLTASVLESYDKDSGLMAENFRFMNSFYTELRDMIKQTTKLRLNFSGFNAETPFDYSKEHGIAFSRLVRNLDDLIKKENLKYITLPFANKVTRILKHGHEFNNKQMMFACSANRSNISIGEDEDTLPFCHREFFANADEPVQKFIKEHYLIHDNQNIAKQRYITSCYTDFPKLKLEYVIIMCKELAECGLIDESYSNYDKAYLLAMVILIPTLCFPAPLTLYASPYISCIGNIKLMANGAFDYLMREAASA